MKRFHTLLLVLILGISSIPAFARGTSEEKLVLAYPQSISSIPVMMVAEEFPEDYSAQVYSDHPQSLAQLINGEIDLLASGFSVGYTRYSAAGDLMHLGGFVWGVSAIMTAEPVSSLAELAGGTLYVPFQGSPVDIQMEAALEAENLADDIEIAYAPFPQAAALLGQKQAQAAVLVEPIASNLELAGRAYRLQNIQDSYAGISGGEPRSPQVSMFIRASQAEQTPAELRRFLSRLEQAIEELQADPAAQAERYAPVFDLPAETIENALRNSLFSLPSAEEDRELVELYARVMNLEAPGNDFYYQR